MKPSICFYAIVLIFAFVIPPALSETEAQVPGVEKQESISYGSTRVSSTRKRTRGRGRGRHSHSKTSRKRHFNNTSFSSTSQGSSSTERSYFNRGSETGSDGRSLFSWNGRRDSYEGSPSGPRNRVISRQITTKTTTKITKTHVDGDPQTTSYTYTYTHPGSSSSTLKNMTFLAHMEQGSSNGSGYSAGGTTRGHASGHRVGGDFYYPSREDGAGEEYLKRTEEDIVYDIDEESELALPEGPNLDPSDLFHPFVIRGLGQARGYGQRRDNPCDQSSCYPATGNLLIGRGDRLNSTSTCGLNHKEKFCIVSHLKHRKKCFWCDSRDAFVGNPRYSHRIQNIVSRFDPRTRLRSWWQSENGREGVSIQLDLEAEFHFTHLIITFRTFRPAAMLIERSYDKGKTWKVYRYFAYNCAESFPGIKRGPPTAISDIVCESRYSEVEPSHMGEVIFRVLQPTIRIENPYSDEVQNLLKITNLRVNFTKLHTLGDQLLDHRPEIKEKYYYAIYDMVVRGSCSCYGHAHRCLPLPQVEDRPDMVHGRCDCTHNTKGLNCKKCKDFYHDLPWRPAVGKETNACKRCECNNHASRCHFDRNVYEASGRISGGVCDECQHNTEGIHCDSCIDYYYQDLSKNIQDPDICQPCNCDTRGTTDDGLCESEPDPAKGLDAGQCHCKDYVDGPKCDRCKPGFWNFSADNPLGCQECSCHTLGTVDNAGCDLYSGRCRCKYNVIGRDCNQCRPQHYGLSDHPDGCFPCNCDRGGAFDNDCDVISGQCRCRPHVNGRQCDRPEEGYFVPYLNYLTFEAELARGSENCQVVMREPFRDGHVTPWTGIGFMRVFDESHLEFEIENIESSMEYDLVIKYEPHFRGLWRGVKVRIVRPDAVDPNGACSKTRASDDTRIIELSDRSIEKTVFPTVCLESGKTYKIILEFSRTDAYNDAPSASILIDSIMLIPRTEMLPFYSESERNRQEYQAYQCSEPFYTGKGLESLPETCVKDHLSTIGLYVFKQSFSCQCDITGSHSTFCNPYGGQCNCKPNVEGRRCNRCAPGTYGFGPQGCLPCECSGAGALDNFCEQQAGKCKCRPNTYDRQCDKCHPGFWNFPDCKRCECNGHADSCDLTTGYCHHCRDNTTGPNCAICQEGFYGDPRLEVGITCRACPCPGTTETDHSFASRCSLDPRTKDVFCECEEGYAGHRCDVCADNYFGNPEVPGGRCRSCDCNNNIDISRPGNCDARTGECLNCLYHTAGTNCEVCERGYYGDALSQQCRECVCDILGTNATLGPCDPFSGQCNCHLNVIGPQCNRCAPNHWKLASGNGCEPCRCDNTGAYSDQCNEYDGQCQCKPGFGGIRCDQCHTNFYGNPRFECKPCECNLEGSKTAQCHHETGKCDCLEGIGGYKCDHCDRGFRGRAPYCEACGECFNNWDFLLDELKERTQSLIGSARQIKQRGATGVYKYEFESMEEKLSDVQKILLSANMTSENLEELDQVIGQLSSELSLKEKLLEEFETSVDNTSQRISLAMTTLADLRLQADDLRDQAGDLKDKATKLQEANVEGALSLTRMAGKQSRRSQAKVESTEAILEESKRSRKQAENILIYKADRFNRTIQENEASLDAFDSALLSMENQIPELNQRVCDRRGDPCDKYCGGAGCGKCGGLSCNDGLVNTALLTLKFAEHTEKLLKKKEASADDLLRGISFAKQRSDLAYNLALMLLEASLKAQNSTAEYKVAVAKLLAEIEEYFTAETAKPDNIKKLADEILNLNIKLRPEQISQLAEKITLTIRSLTDIETIIDATRNDLDIASDLKERADRAKMEAEETLEVAQRVVDALNKSSVAQEAAETAISRATDDISATEGYLTQIASETATAQEQANASRSSVLSLSERVDMVQAEFKINQQHLQDTRTAVDQAALTAQKATNEARELEDKYYFIEEQLEAKSKAAEDARKRADDLKRRANKLSAEVIAKLDFLKDMRAVFMKNELTLDAYDADLSLLEERMHLYQEYILHKANVYTACTADKSSI